VGGLYVSLKIMNQPNPYQSPQTTPGMPFSSSKAPLIVKVLMWAIWILFLQGISVLLSFAYRPDPSSNQWTLGFEWVIALAILLVISLTFRFLLMKKIKNIWIQFLVFLVGLFFADMIAVTGMFALLSGQKAYILIGVVSILLYCPHWIKLANKSQ
jgi:uncharacterized membrane protein